MLQLMAGSLGGVYPGETDNKQTTLYRTRYSALERELSFKGHTELFRSTFISFGSDL